MKNHQIRARRAEGSAVSAPEYAVNCLNVDIILAKGRSDVRELSVRLYTSAYRLMGVAARQASSSKAIRTWHFEVSSSDAWTGGTYRAFVYVNGVPSWKAELFLYTGEGIDSSARLESLEPGANPALYAKYRNEDMGFGTSASSDGRCRLGGAVRFVGIGSLR